MSMQTVAMGLLVVVLDVPATGWDWIADPLGWVLVLLGLAAARDAVPNYRGLSTTAWVCLGVSVVIYPPSSVATLDDGLGWVFSVPTVVWCFLVSDALHDVAHGGRRTTLFWLRNVFVAVGLLPLLVYLAGLDALTVPTAVLAVGANVVLLYLLWTTPDTPDGPDGPDEAGESAAAPPPPSREKSRPSRLPERPITGAEVVAKVRKRRKTN